MINIIAVGGKHASWAAPGINQFEKRLRPPYNVVWHTLPHSSGDKTTIRDKESAVIIQRLAKYQDSHIILLDERGRHFDSPSFSSFLHDVFNSQPIVIIIGGAYGVSDAVRQAANTTMSLSQLVFPHQLVRLLLIEQLYRAQQIQLGSQYHHQ